MGKEMEREVRLVEEFGLRNISQQDVGVDHYFVRRGLIFTVHGYEEFKEALQSGDFYTLTGIMPSSERIHLGTMAVVEALKCFAEKF